MALTQIQQGMLVDGILTADTAGRLKVADGFVNDAKISAMAASKLTGRVPSANATSGSVINVQLNQDTNNYQTNPGGYNWTTIPNYGGTYTMQNSSNKLIVSCHAHVVSQSNQGCIRFQYSLNSGSTWTTFPGIYATVYTSIVHGQIFGFSNSLAHFIHVQHFYLTPAASSVQVRLQGVVDGASDISYNRTPNNVDQGISGPSSVLFLEVTP